MTLDEAINIAEEFDKWLEDTAKKYGWDKKDVKVIIKQFLRWGGSMTREEITKRLNLILITDTNTLKGFTMPHEPLEKEIEALKEAIELINQEPILDKIYADIQKLRGCSCGCSDGIIDDVEDIIDKYKAESEEEIWQTKT